MCAGTYGGQKKALDPPDLELHTIISCQLLECWELNSGPVEKRQVLITADPSLQAQFLPL